MKISYKINDRALSAQSFIELANAVWARAYDETATQSALAKTMNITAWVGDKLVGCVRILTDGVYFGTITEILVLKEYRGQGIGRELMRLVQENTPTKLYFGAQEGVEGFYEKVGCKRGMLSYTVDKK